MLIANMFTAVVYKVPSVQCLNCPKTTGGVDNQRLPMPPIRFCGFRRVLGYKFIYYYHYLFSIIIIER